MDPKNLKSWAGGGKLNDKADEAAKAKQLAEKADAYLRGGKFKEAMYTYTDAAQTYRRAGAPADGVKMDAKVAATKRLLDQKDAEDNPRTRDASGQVRPRLGEESKFDANRGHRR